MKSIDILMQEHRVIEHGIKVLENIVKKMENNDNKINLEKVVMLLDFFKVFADNCHHAKEEDILFPYLEDRGIAREGGPIGVMLFEHQEGRELQKIMRESILNGLNEEDKKKFIRAAYEYINLLKQHIYKEDNVLFRMAEQVLDNYTDNELVSKFEDYENNNIGKDVHEYYHNFIHDLEKEFLIT